MKTVLLALVIIIIVIGTAGIGVLYIQQSQQIAALQTDVSTITTNMSGLQSNPSAPFTSAALTQSPGEPAVLPSTFSTDAPVSSLVSKYTPVVVRLDVTGGGFIAAGSGFVIDSSGYILTNQHVVNQARAIRVTFSNGQPYSATITASDAKMDLAIIKVGGNLPVLPTATLGTASDIVIGGDVLAMGFPLGTDLPGPVSITRGIISAERTLNGIQYIQTDVTINPGNSGGCLITLNGKVIGVTTAGVVPEGIDAENIGLAVPVTVFQPYIQNNLKK